MPPRISVYVVAGDDRATLERGLASLRASTSRTADVSVVVLAADPNVVGDAAMDGHRTVLGDPRFGRLMWGSDARLLNWCLVDAFESWRNPTDTAWCVCAPASAVWTPGWDRWLHEQVDTDVVVGAAAEHLVAVNLEGLLEVGLFDERFTTLSHHQDWFVRALLRLGGRVSTDLAPLVAVGGARAQHGSPEGERSAGALLRWKWRFDDPTDDFLLTPTGFAHATSLASSPPDEIDWYPGFWAGAPLDRYAHRWFVGRRADQSAPTPVDALQAVNDLAVMAYGRGDTLGAARLLIEVLEADPAHPDAVHNLGAVLSAIGTSS